MTELETNFLLILERNKVWLAREENWDLSFALRIILEIYCGDQNEYLIMTENSYCCI